MLETHGIRFYFSMTITMQIICSKNEATERDHMDDGDDCSQLVNCQTKKFPLQAWTGTEGFRRLRLPYFKTFGHSAHKGGKVVSPTHRLPLPAENIPGTYVRSRVDPRAIMRPEGLCQ